MRKYMNQSIIDYYKNKPLSDKDILKLVKNKSNLTLYPNLYKYKNIDEVLEPNGASFILYETKPSYGHWCLIFKRTPDLLEFFDPYGSKFIDEELNFVPKEFRKVSHQDVPYLSLLMIESPYRLSYNKYQFQKRGDNIKDCGRWCALRLIFKDYPIKLFAYLFQGKNSDDIATLFTI